jgi:DNA-cytosine methyltransferase
VTLTAASCFSGIGAPEVAMPHWDWRWCAEIEKFPSAGMAARHPKSVNLGDVTADDFMQRASAFGQLDVLCAGSPCQSFSVAGLRKGMDDPRGNLTLRFLAIVNALKPKCILWENVPGILSDKDDAFGQFLDGLEELGYIYDADILDAQWHGLAQRRRRVFVCAHRLEDLLQQRTITSALTVIQLLTECLLLILAAARPSLMIDSESLAFNASEPKLSLQRRMKQFGMDSRPDGSAHLSHTMGIKSSQSITQMAPHGEFQNTDKSWLIILDALFQTVSECIISTAKNPITESKIFGCAQMIALITARITPSMASQPTFWSAALSTSTAMKAFTDYARQTTSDLFADPKLVRSWLHFIRENERAEKTVGDIGVECFGEILPVSESVLRHPPARRQAGKDVTGTIAARSKGGGGLGTDFDLDGGLVTGTLKASAGRSRGAGTPVSILCADVAPTLDANFGDKMGQDNQHINGGGGCSLPSVAMCLNAGAMQRLDPTFETLIPTNRCDFDVEPCCYDTTQITSAGNYSNPQPGDACHPTAASAHVPLITVPRPVAFPARLSSTQYAASIDKCPSLGAANPMAVATQWSVRRLTPTECERLQGFPDGFTDIEYRGKPAADGPRYKALGNSWAVPCGRWIMERIERFMP